MFEQHNFNDPWSQDEVSTENWWWGAIIILLILGLATFFPKECQGKTIPCDTIPIAWCQVDTIFQHATKSGKSEKFFVVFMYKGYKDITNISKSNVEYINMCKKYGITPKVALRCRKNGEILSLIVTKKRRL